MRTVKRSNGYEHCPSLNEHEFAIPVVAWYNLGSITVLGKAKPHLLVTGEASSDQDGERVREAHEPGVTA